MKTIAVVAGDELCVRTAIGAWATPTKLVSPEPSNPHAQRDDGVTAAFFLGVPSDVVPWPGGPLVWLLPERGPSVPELAQLRVAATLAPTLPEPWVLVCVEPECEFPSEPELLAIERALQRALAPGQSFRLGVVARTRRDSEHSLARFLRQLGTHDVA
jgi:hypothetical protein